jgi:acid phosphatase class B
MADDLLLDWVRDRPKTRAIICDIDDTICTMFDVPFQIACEVLRQLDRAIEVHYVTARPEASRDGTVNFLMEHRLPGWRNLYFCPNWQSSRLHKTEVMQRIARQYQVLASIGDHDEDEAASRAAGVPFVRITDASVEQAWQQVVRLVGAAAGEPTA